MTAISNSPQTGIGLDVGAKRIGVASANLSVRFAGPLTTLDRPDSFIDDVLEICRSEGAAWLVIGRPRGMNGQQTAQTEQVQAFGAELAAALQAAQLDIPIHWTDEALTSAKAEAELASRPGKRTVQRNGYAKSDVDALAATYILEDFLAEQGDTRGEQTGITTERTAS